MESDRSTVGPYKFTVGDESPSSTVVEAVAELEAMNVTELPALYETLDPDALDQLYDSCTDARVTFSYYDYRIAVDTDGSVTVQSRA
jgi:hypothetical protein